MPPRETEDAPATPRPRPLPAEARALRALRHAARLLGDLVAYAVVNRAFALVALILVLLALGFVVLAGEAAVPLLYPFF